MVTLGINRTHALFLLLDLLLIVLAGLPWVVMQLAGKPFERGYYCNDESIMHPVKDQTIPAVAAFIGGFSIVILVIVTLELINWRMRPGPKTLRDFLTLLIIALGLYLFGCAVTMSFTDITKVAVGRLRPNFLALCKPSDLNVKCVPGATIYRTGYVCTNNNAKEVKESRMSFMSGHSSFSFFTAVYLAVFLVKACPVKKSILLVPTLQFGLVAMAAWVAYTRISDYWHHWADVLSGAALGTGVALAAGIFMLTKREEFLKTDSGEAIKLTDPNQVEIGMKSYQSTAAAE